MKKKDEILEILASNKEAIAEKYHIGSIGLFGSFARGDSTEGSDIDILVSFSESIGMEIVDLVMELEELLGHKVDLVSSKAIKPKMMPYIEEDIIYV